MYPVGCINSVRRPNLATCRENRVTYRGAAETFTRPQAPALSAKYVSTQVSEVAPGRCSFCSGSDLFTVRAAWQEGVASRDGAATWLLRRRVNPLVGGYRLAARRDKRNTLIQPRLGSGNWWRSAIQSAHSRLSRWKILCRANFPPSRPNRQRSPPPPRSRSSRKRCRHRERGTRLR